MDDSNSEQSLTRNEQGETLTQDKQNAGQSSQSQTPVVGSEGAGTGHWIDMYGPIVVAALEGLRSAIYPHSRLEDFSKSHKPYQREAGWAIGVDTRIESFGTETSRFEAYVHVSLVFNEKGEPVCFECRGQRGHKTRTSRGDLTKEGLVRALECLLAEQEGKGGLVWRWLGHQEE
jgi:hypothetical protein